MSGCRELAVLERSGLPESRHLGAAVVADSSGHVVRSVGDADGLVYPRSSLKPLQAIATLRAGAVLTEPQLVLAAASHGGTAEHLAIVRSTLESVGLDEDALRCPVDWPLDAAARRSTAEPSRLAMNCSGKHAAFLAACAASGWDLDGYLDPRHPLQVVVRATIEEYTGATVEHTGVDGCGAPVPALSLRALATGIARVGRRADADAHRLVGAVLAHPWALDGAGRPNTVVIERLGVVAKVGAEGVMVMVAPGGPAVAVKVLDGSARASTLVALELLVAEGAVGRDAVDDVLAAVVDPTLGGGAVVGGLRYTGAAHEAVAAGE